jgi:hypothetical protein
VPSVPQREFDEKMFGIYTDPESELKIFFLYTKAFQILPQRQRKRLEPTLFFAWFGENMAVLHHVGWGQVAEIYSDIVAGIPGDPAHVIHHVQH